MICPWEGVKRLDKFDMCLNMIPITFGKPSLQQRAVVANLISPTQRLHTFYPQSVQQNVYNTCSFPSTECAIR